MNRPPARGDPARVPCHASTALAPLLTLAVLGAHVGCTARPARAPAAPPPLPPPPARAGLFPFQEPANDVGPSSRWGYRDRAGAVRIAPQFGRAGPFRDGLACVERDGRFGFIDPTGAYRVAPTLAGCGPFAAGLAPARGPTGWGYVDAQGRWVVEPTLPFAHPLAEGLAPRHHADGYVFIDATGAPALPGTFELVGTFSGGLAPVVVDGKLGYVDRAGRIVIQATWPFERVQGFVEEMGLADGRVRIEVGCVHRYRQDGEEVPRPDAALRDPGWMALGVEVSGCAYGYADAAGATIIPPRFSAAGRFSEGLAAVRAPDDAGYGYVDVDGRVVIPGPFSRAGRFSEGRAFVTADGVNLLVDRAGERTPLPTDVEGVAPFDDGLAEARLEGGGWGYVDAEGRLVWSRPGGRPRLSR
jgi:hypothetical protein